jgi:hypothetical protein
MKPKELGAAVEKVLEQALAKGGDAFAPIFRSLLVRLQQALATLQTDAFGNIAQTPDNYQKVLSFVNEIVARTFSPEAMRNVVSVFVEAMEKTANLSNVYFTATSKAFNAVDPVLIAGRAAAISQAASAAAPPAADLSSFLSRLLTDSISRGSSYEQMAQSLAERLTGADSPMQRYVKTIAKDAVMQFNRNYDMQVAKYYRMVFYLYEGGLQTTSRPFCKQREGRYYHEREIRSWARENWEGKNPDTNENNIFSLAGGFNCNHKFIPVDNSIVPPAAVERALRLKWLSQPEYDLYFKKNK